MFPRSYPLPWLMFLRAAWLIVFTTGAIVYGQTGETSAEQDSLTLEEALSMGLARNPGLASLELEIQAREARTQQAGTPYNPELSLEAENFAGSGNLSGVDGMETTLGLGQVLELGGKRSLRKKLAGSEKDLARWDLKSAQVGLKSEMRGAFTEVLAAQERLRILQDGLGVNKQLLETAKLRHNAGKAPATEEMKARMAYSLNHIEIDRAAQELQSARIRLASFWSIDPPGFKGAKGELRTIPPLPPLEGLVPALRSHPDLARWKSEIAQRRFSADAAKAASIPDLSIGAGVRHLNDRGNGDVAVVAGVSLPLPLANRNKGSIREAGHRLAQADREKQAVESRLLARLRNLHQTLSARSEEIAHLKDELLPDAARTLQASRDAYQMGKLSFLEVLDSQRTLFEINTRFIATLAEYHKDWSGLEAIVSTETGKSNERQ